MSKPIIGSIVALVVLVVLGLSIYTDSSPVPAASYGSPTGTVATPSGESGSPTGSPVAPTPTGNPTGKPVSIPPRVTPTTPNPPAPNIFTIANVAAHNSASSCYSVVSGSVYDLTPWISQHPGGAQAILSMCGVDATDAFIAQHGGQRRPEAELVSFKIGTLAP